MVGGRTPRQRTCRVFTDEVVLGFTVVVVPLEHVETPHTGRSRRLVIHDHTHFVTARWLVPVPVPTHTHTRTSIYLFEMHEL